VGIRSAALRYSFIHCTYNLVMQRFAVSAAGFVLLPGPWAALAIGLAGNSTA